MTQNSPFLDGESYSVRRMDLVVAHRVNFAYVLKFYKFHSNLLSRIVTLPLFFVTKKYDNTTNNYY